MLYIHFSQLFLTLDMTNIKKSYLILIFIFISMMLLELFSKAIKLLRSIKKKKVNISQ